VPLVPFLGTLCATDPLPVGHVHGETWMTVSRRGSRTVAVLDTAPPGGVLVLMAEDPAGDDDAYRPGGHPLDHPGRPSVHHLTDQVPDLKPAGHQPKGRRAGA
jgi:hypothetical protein